MMICKMTAFNIIFASKQNLYLPSSVKVFHSYMATNNPMGHKFNFMKKFLLTTAALACAISAFSVGWEQVLAEKAMQTVFCTSDGVLLAADYKFDYSGGIYRSTDKGNTWEKTTATDHNYTAFTEHNGVLFAAGYGGMTRSRDGGVTWEELPYCDALTGYIPDNDPAESSVVYGFGFKGDRLYAAEFNGYVLYSDNMGDNWTVTDPSGMAVNPYGDSQPFQDALYALVVYKDKVLAGGLYQVYMYDETANTWTPLENVGNCMAVYTEVDGILFAGHAIEDDNENNPFVQYTTDCVEWGGLSHPAGFLSNYVRSMTGFDKTLIVGTMYKGVYTTSDMGETWNAFANGLFVSSPEGQENITYLNIISMANDEEYVYAALYELPFVQHNGSGIYRIPKSELTAGISDAISDNRDASVHVMEDEIIANGGVSTVLYDIRGAVVASGIDKVQLAGLTPGIYIYKVNFEDAGPACGKVIVK